MTTPAFAVNWWQVGWIVANNVIDRVVNLDGQSSNDQYSTYMVSPSIVFNNGTNGGEFYMRPQVSSRVTSFEMHAHRANPVDFGANIVLALSTTSGKRVINKTVGTNQYVSYTRSSSDGTGTWDARFTEDDSGKNWQCYYRQYYGNGRSLPTIIDVPNTNLIDYLANDGTTFRYNANPDQPRTTKAPTLDIKQLNNQFYDEKSGISVDYLRDYNTGDDIIFEDIIDKTQFNPNENNTSLFFLLDNEYIEWKFNGNITNKYKKEDRINLHFKVITVKQYKGITFESIDFFKDSSNGINKTRTIPLHLRLPKIRRTMQYIYLTALALLGLCMLIFPRQLWKISNFLWTQKGDPSNLYTSLMRISGAAFLVLALILFIFCRLQ